MGLNNEDQKMDWTKIQEKLKEGGPKYWRGLDELAETDEYKLSLEDEFPHRKSLLDVDRRSFLKFTGASLALAGLAGCRNLPQERLVPHVKAPEDRIPGVKEQYASSFSFAGFGFPILVDSKEGRPTKIDGHVIPGFTGATDVFTHAELLSMYDPDRLGTPLQDGLVADWKELNADCAPKMLKGKTAILTEKIASPTVERLIGIAKAKNPSLQVFEYDTVNSDSEQAGITAVFGKPLTPVYDFSANTILSLDADFLSGSPHSVANAAGFASRRDPDNPKGMNRLYAVESSAGLTGAAADHRVAIKPSQVEAVAGAIASRFGIQTSAPKLPAAVSEKWVDACAEDLKAGGVIVAGAHQTPFVHAIAHLINQRIGGNVKYYASAAPAGTLKDLVAALDAGAFETVFILGGNPVYGAPGDLKFGEKLLKVKTTVYVGTEANETSAVCKWTAAASHFLEAWGDSRTQTGRVLVQQPLIAPLRDTRSAASIIAGFVGVADTEDVLVQKTHGLDAKAWRKALHDGFVSNTGSGPVSVNASGAAPAPSAASGDIEAVFLPDPTIYDGRYANNGWLQELPKPLTKLTWDNAVIMSPNTAKKLSVADEAMVSLTVGDRSVKAPVYIQPGHSDDVVTLHLGYGRTKGGKVMPGTGFDFAQLRTSTSPGFAPVTIAKDSGSYSLASTQLHHSMEGRDIVREGTLAHYKENPSLHHEEGHAEEAGFYNLTEEWAKENPDLPQWGMTIDLTSCVGCNACAIACQAENNIPTVGKIEAQRHRQMHWIRIDRYYRVAEGHENRDLDTGSMKLWNFEPVRQANLSGPIRDDAAMNPNNVTTVFQPIPCMHCEVAPCEPVCPVEATLHSKDGLNQMVYNRCVGTRYCSNNCPYKVRRFNYYNYQHGQDDPGLMKPYGQRNFLGEEDKPTLKLLNNPDVTVRSRGVMEKCTYCVHRINEARIAAKKDGVDLKDGSIKTACQQACPTGAIQFGNIADPNSKVSATKKNPRNYSLLSEVGTKPRTTYLGRVRNPNATLENA